MNNTLIKAKPSSKQSNSRDTKSFLKVVVFSIGNLKLALRIETAYKVLNQTPVYGIGSSGVGIANVGDRDVTVVDLHRQLFRSSNVSEGVNKGYLLIIQNKAGELYGIPVAGVPALMELPLANIRVLPQSYRHADVFGFATHVCHIPQAEALTIFLLDVDQMLLAP